MFFHFFFFNLHYSSIDLKKCNAHNYLQLLITLKHYIYFGNHKLNCISIEKSFTHKLLETIQVLPTKTKQKFNAKLRFLVKCSVCNCKNYL